MTRQEMFSLVLAVALASILIRLVIENPIFGARETGIRKLFGQLF